MNTSNSSTKRLDPQFSIKGLDQAFTSMDANRATGYTQLGQVRTAKSASLVREQKLLNAKYGTATPRAQYAAAVLTKNEQFRREIAAAREVLEAKAPEVDENSFVVYGFVRRKNQAGIPGLTLALTDEQGTWLRQFGYACTDKRGYFELRIERQTSEKTEAEIKKQAELQLLQKERETAAATAAGGQSTESTSTGIKTNVEKLSSGMRINTNQNAYARTGAQLRVFNRNGRVLHVEARPVVPKAATADYRLIILDDEDCGCTPPPEKSDGKPSPSAPSTPAAPPPAPAQPAPAPASAEPRVAGMKAYANPTTKPSQSLEAIRGIGPKTATKLRAAGIDDVAEFEKTEGSALVKLAGFDKTPPRPAAAKTNPAAKPGETPAKQPSRSTAAREKKSAKKSSDSVKAKRPKK